MGINRREFVKTVSAISLSHVLSTSTGLFAAGQEKIKLGLVGCGGRGTGALGDCLKAAEHLGIQAEIVALGDYFLDKAKQAAQSFKVSEERCFAGIDAYKKVIASEADVVLLVTPPAFRPVHFQAAIDAGKHVFMEKPVAVDAPGARQVIETGKLAAEKKLAVVAGTQRRHQAVYRRNQLAVKNGQIGKVISGRVSWLWPALWYKTRIEGESDADYMIRNWVSFTEMSGDHIVEQHLHNIDIANWFIGRPPESAMGFGGRARRKTGNQYDFSVSILIMEMIFIFIVCRARYRAAMTGFQSGLPEPKALCGETLSQRVDTKKKLLCLILRSLLVRMCKNMSTFLGGL